MKIVSLDKEAIEKHLKYLREDKHCNEFYVALLLYDIKGINDIKDLTDEDIEAAFDIQDEYDSVYNEDMRERFLYDLNLEKESCNEEIERDLEK